MENRYNYLTIFRLY